MSSLSRNQLESWIKNIDVKGSVLDIGGGQKSLEGRVKSFNPDPYVILDIEKGDVIHDVCTPCKFDDLFKMQKKKFDMIFCLEVSEYFVNPAVAILNISDWISDFGKVYMSFHFIYPIHKPDGDDMLRYTDNWVKKAFNYYGFRNINILNRMATSNKLKDFYSEEKMKRFKDEDVIGYLVEASKR